MSAISDTSRQLLYVTLLVAAAVLTLLPVVIARASAYGQMEPRSIKLSSAVPGATSVSYQLVMTPVTTAQELIIDFCSDTPIVGTVAAPSPCSFSAASTPVVTGVAASAGTASAVSNHTIKVVGLTMTGGSPFTIDFTGITNPTNTATFYARILTYATGKASEYVPASSTGGNTTIATVDADVTDAGGAALSTTTTINLTAKIMEQLTFCTSGSAITTDCTSTTAPNLILGHNNGSGTLILDSSAVDTIQAFTQLSSNASNGVDVRMKDVSSTACGGMSSDGGTTCNIQANGASATAIATNTARFGMCVAPATANTIADAPYSGTCTGSGNTYGMDQTTAGNNVISTYGSKIFHTASSIHQENDTLTFAAAASDTTPAGIYVVSESLIATGKY